MDNFYTYILDFGMVSSFKLFLGQIGLLSKTFPKSGLKVTEKCPKVPIFGPTNFSFLAVFFLEILVPKNLNLVPDIIKIYEHWMKELEVERVWIFQARVELKLQLTNPSWARAK